MEVYMLNNRLILGFLIILMIPFITGCLTTTETDSAMKATSGSGVLSVSITDVPLQNIQRLNVKIAEVSVKKIMTDESEQWIELKTDVPMFNIVDYRNGILYMLASKQMEPGFYKQFRIRFLEAELVENGVIKEMMISEDFSEGLILNYEFEMTSKKDVSIVMDLDLERSVIQNGDNYTFYPVINVNEKEKAGSISGRVYPIDSLAKVEAYNTDGVRVNATIIRSDGSFVLAYLTPGSYNLMVIASGYEIDTSIKNVIVKPNIITPGIKVNLSAE